MHRRKAIRDAAAAALTGLALTGTRVYPNRTADIPKDLLPAIRIYLTGESRSTGDTFNGDLVSVITMRVEVLDRALDDVEDRIDAACEDVEAALDVDQTLSGACRWLRLASVEIDYEDEDQTVMQATLDYEVTHVKD